MKNPMGDIIGIMDRNGDIVCTYEYDAWGKITAITGNTGIANANPLRYRGYVYDAESGLYYCGSRYYDPAVGRWIGADDVGIAAVAPGRPAIDKNLFAYCSNNPVNNYDPTGLETKAVGVGGSAAFGLGGEGDISLVWDDDGNIGLLYTWGVHVSSPQAAIGVTATFTNANTIFDLVGELVLKGGGGPGVDAGFAVGPVGADFVGGNGVDGIPVAGAQFSLGFSVLPVDGHGGMSSSYLIVLKLGKKAVLRSSPKARKIYSPKGNEFLGSAKKY
jgi:RHS repeat-associated protein